MDTKLKQSRPSKHISRIAGPRVTQFQTQQLSMANNPKWVAYNERFAEGLRKAGLPE
jgi:hypothetical protein